MKRHQFFALFTVIFTAIIAVKNCFKYCCKNYNFQLKKLIFNLLNHGYIRYQLERWGREIHH